MDGLKNRWVDNWINGWKEVSIGRWITESIDELIEMVQYGWMDGGNVKRWVHE